MASGNTASASQKFIALEHRSVTCMERRAVVGPLVELNA
jgi:hypothetical protein